MNLEKYLLKVKPIKYIKKGKSFFKDPYILEGYRKTECEILKTPQRTDIINFLLSVKQGKTSYLEIGVRNPSDNFNDIKADTKYSVDPGIEYKKNPVDFNMTSDVFFQKLSQNEILSQDIKFDVIFIDGLHLAQQVDRDIYNSLKYIKDDGFIVLHDCNPPTEWHARESYYYHNTPAGTFWNGTTWKAFLKWRFNSSVHSCCIDSDWGIGVLSKGCNIGESIDAINPFFEFSLLDENRPMYLNLIDFDSFMDVVRGTKNV